MSNLAARKAILTLAESITPFDELEREQQAAIIAWIRSGVEIFRIQKPDKPPKHLVVYFVVVDQKAKKVLLVDHIKAQCWLPPGGHVEMDEHPTATVRREIQEELRIAAHFILTEPLLLTETVTYGLTPGHTDVTFWYIVAGDCTQEVDFDKSEFKRCHWFSYEEILAWDIKTLDPHMHRFVRKLQEHLTK